MTSERKLAFAAICGAALAPPRRRRDVSADMDMLAVEGDAVIIYADCEARLAAKAEAGESVAAALTEWIAEADAALTIHRADRARFTFVEQRVAALAPIAVCDAIEARMGVAPEAGPLAAAPQAAGPLGRLAARYALSQSSYAQSLAAELAASSVSATLTDEEQARLDAARGAPEDCDSLVAEIQTAMVSPAAHAALQTEAAKLRDLLDHAQGARQAERARAAEQARKIDIQHDMIRRLERELGEARGEARQMRGWLQAPNGAGLEPA